MSTAAMHVMPREPRRDPVTTPGVPPEIFRRRVVGRLIDKAHSALTHLEQALLLEYELSAKAARLDLAAKAIEGLDQYAELRTELLRARDLMVERAQEAIKFRMRDYSTRPSRKGVPLKRRGTDDGQ